MIGIYHSRDLDGYCSGAIIKKKYPEATLIGFDYDQGLQKLLDLIPKGEKIIMADVSLPMSEMHLLWEHSNGSLTWIDHHASAIKDYEEYHKTHCQHALSFMPVLEDGISACEGTWKWLFPGQDMPRSVELLGQYDTWRNSDKELWDKYIMPFQFGMRLDVNSPESFPHYLLDESLTTDEILNIIKTGNILLKYQKQQNVFSMKKAFVINFQGYRTLACNGGSGSTSFESIWDEEKHDLMMTFKYTGIKWVFGVYTTKDIDLSAIAKIFGGGGHKKAAGFTCEGIPDFIFNHKN